MAMGGGPRPSVAPRTPAHAPRTTRAYTRRAFPPETSGPATRPRRGLAPRAAQVTVTGRGYFFASVTRSPHPTAPACSYDPCASKAISARLPCAVRERQGARPVARRRAARPTGTPITRSCGARRHMPSCGSKYQCPSALQESPKPSYLSSPSGDADGPGTGAPPTVSKLVCSALFVLH
jgi:hypothetical protein